MSCKTEKRLLFVKDSMFKVPESWADECKMIHWCVFFRTDICSVFLGSNPRVLGTTLRTSDFEDSCTFPTLPDNFPSSCVRCLWCLCKMRGIWYWETHPEHIPKPFEILRTSENLSNVQQLTETSIYVLLLDALVSESGFFYVSCSLVENWAAFCSDAKVLADNW